MSVPASVLFVCMGNICRSPLAEGIARRQAAELGLNIRFDSAGTHAYHCGEPADPRARALARHRRTPIDDLRARQIQIGDFEAFDWVLAADRDNLALMQSRFGPAAEKAQLLLQACDSQSVLEVPDPYYGGEQQFEQVFDLLEGSLGRLLRSWAKLA